MKKVLHINFSDYGGGAEELARSLSQLEGNHLLVKKKHGTQSHVIEIPKSKTKTFISILDKIVWKLGFKKSFRALFGIQDELHRTYNQLKKLGEYRDAEILHFHNIHGEYFDLRSIKKIAREKKIVWTSHDMWIMSGGEGFIIDGMTKRERLNCYPLRGPILDTREYYKALKYFILSKNQKNLVVVAPSEYHMNRLQEYLKGGNIKLIYSGIDIDLFNTQNVSKEGLPKVLIFNSKSPYKNSKEVIRALRRIKSNYELHVIGAPLQMITDRQNNHGIIKDRKKLARLFKQIDIAAFSSKEETFGLFPAELAACGAQVFLNQTLEVFKEHQSMYGAILFLDEENLCVKLKKAIDHINETRIQGRHSSELLSRKLSRQKSSEKYIRLYNSIIDN